MNLREMTKQTLERSRYHGLFCEDLGCGCTCLDLMPCGNPSPDCEPAYIQPDPTGESDYWVGPDRWRTGETLELLIERATEETDQLRRED